MDDQRPVALLPVDVLFRKIPLPLKYVPFRKIGWSGDGFIHWM